MSILSKIETFGKTIAHEIEAALTAFKKDEPKIEQIVVSTIQATGPLVVALAAVISGNPAATEALAILQAVESRLAAAQVVVTSLGSATGVKSLLTLVVSDLQSILSVASIKDTALVATVTSDVNRIVAGLQVVLAAL